MPLDSPLELAVGTVDLVRATLLRRDGSELSLTTRECALLDRLARSPGTSVSRESLLVDVWAHHPDSLSRAVDHTMRRLRAKVEVDPAHPQHLLTVHGEGYRFVPLPTPATRGKAAGADFIGRSEALRALQQAVDDAAESAHCVQVLGPGGVGKTRLVQEWMAPTVRFVDLSETRTRGQVVAAIARGLGVGRRNVDAVLADTQPTLVLDNAEQVVVPLSEWLALWTAGRPGPAFVLTSRIALAVPGPIVRLVGLPEAAAVQLYRSRAARTRASDAPAIATLVSRLDGLPLAIELAAARATVLGPSELLSRLDQRFAALGRRDHGPLRHRALDDTIEWSWSLLDAPQQAALTQLAAFSGGFSPAAVEGIIGPEGLDVVAGLVDASLASFDAQGRGRLPESVRAFVLQRTPDATRMARHAHLHHFQAWSAAAPPAVAAELDNLLAACRFSIAEGSPDLGLVELLEPVLAAQGPPEAWDELTVAVSTLGPRGARVAARRQLALGDAPAAQRTLAGVTDLASHDPDHHLLVARVRRALRDFSSAQASLDRGIVCAPAGSMEHAGIVHQAGLLAFDQGQWGPARDQFQGAHQAWQLLARPLDMARAALHLGHIALELGDVDEAVARYEQARCATADDRRGWALATVHWALSLIELHDLDPARRALTDARDTFVQLGDRRFAAFADLVAAEHALESGDLHGGRRAAARARMVLSDLGDETFAAAASARVLAACALQGDGGGAVRAAQRATQGPDRPREMTRLVAALVQAAKGERAAARVVVGEVKPTGHLQRRLHTYLSRAVGPPR